MSQLISVLMTDANIMDTVVYYVSMPIMSMGPILGIFALFVFNLIFNFFIPSATAQCYVVMPIQIGIADLAGINPQVAIEAYKLGDAITNMTWPTVPTFMACLAMLNIPYDKWLKWSFKWLICGLGSRSDDTPIDGLGPLRPYDRMAQSTFFSFAATDRSTFVYTRAKRRIHSWKTPTQN